MKLVIQDNDGNNLVGINFTPDQGLCGDLQQAIQEHFLRTYRNRNMADGYYFNAMSAFHFSLASESGLARQSKKAQKLQ
jgi:hypothetical protein